MKTPTRNRKLLLRLTLLLENTSRAIASMGGLTFFAGVALAAVLIPNVYLPSLRGSYIISFLANFVIAAGAYFVAVWRLEVDRIPLALIWTLAVLFRLIMLFTTPTLSDDVFRYIWDGHLLGLGVNPYRFPVNSPALDVWDIPQRALVNHAWMASPYLPVAQLYFGLLYWLTPQTSLGFQIAAVVFDLGAGWLVMDMLGQMDLPKRRVLLYLWNPLVVIEFAHGAHMDSLMILLMVLALWLLIRDRKNFLWYRATLTGSVFALAAATLTKGLPVLLAPLFIRRWGWRRLALFGIMLLLISGSFARGAGWGLFGALNGTGVFGAIRIFLSWWNYNSSLYHWLEVALSGYPTPGAVPLEIAGYTAIRIGRLITASILALVVLATGVWVWRIENPSLMDELHRNRALIRLACVPLGAYLLLTSTLHPWYVAVILPFIPFLLPADQEKTAINRFVWPWLYLSCAVVFSYLTYIDPLDFREFTLVRRLEYLPFYLLLIWALLLNLLRSGLFQNWRRGEVV